MERSRSISGQYFGDDAPAGGIYNPVNLNSYQYASNNPVRYTDPTGKWAAGHHMLMSAFNCVIGAIQEHALGNTDAWIFRAIEFGFVAMGQLSCELGLIEDKWMNEENHKSNRNTLIGVSILAFAIDISFSFVEKLTRGDDGRNIASYISLGIIKSASGFLKGIRDFLLQEYFAHGYPDNADNGDRKYLGAESGLIGGISLLGTIVFASKAVDAYDKKNMQDVKKYATGFVISCITTAVYAYQIFFSKYGINSGENVENLNYPWNDSILYNFGGFASASMIGMGWEFIHTTLATSIGNSLADVFLE